MAWETPECSKRELNATNGQGDVKFLLSIIPAATLPKLAVSMHYKPLHRVKMFRVLHIIRN